MDKKLNILIPMHILLLFYGSPYNIGTVFIFFEQLIGLKGSLTRDFRAQVFFMNQCPPGP